MNLEPSVNMQRMMDLANKVSFAGRHPVFTHGCVVVNGNSILATAANSERGHAEVRAIKKAGIENCEGATIYVVRSQYRMSKPCANCEKFLRACSVKRVVYSDWDGSVTIWNLE